MSYSFYCHDIIWQYNSIELKLHKVIITMLVMVVITNSHSLPDHSIIADSFPPYLKLDTLFSTRVYINNSRMMNVTPL